MPVEGFEPYAPEDAALYNRRRWWLGLTWGDLLDKAADLYPDKVGLVDDTHRFTLGQVRERTDRLAVGLMGLGIATPRFRPPSDPQLARIRFRILCPSEDRRHPGPPHSPSRSRGDQARVQPHPSRRMDRPVPIQKHGPPLHFGRSEVGRREHQDPHLGAERREP